jgi:hypothetical protein
MFYLDLINKTVKKIDKRYVRKKETELINSCRWFKPILIHNFYKPSF